MKGLETQYMELSVQAEGDKWDAEWKGVKSRYWPIIYFADESESANTDS
jgi:hypothetical protein